MRYLFSLLLLSICFIGISQDKPYQDAQLLIQLKNGTADIPFIRKFETENQMSIYRFQCLSKTAGIYQVEFTDQAIDLDKVTHLFYTYPEIISVQKNHFITLRETIPSDTIFTQQWFLKNTGQTGGTVDSDIDATDAWDITTGGLTTHNDTIVVCIIESAGVEITHNDLKDNIWHNYAEIPGNAIDDDNNGYVDDFNGWNVFTLNDQVGSGSHGTRVAGMIGASGNNVLGVSGVNWNVKMMIIKGQNATDEASVIAAYDYPLNMRKTYNETFGAAGAFVVATNASWGIDNGDPANAPLWCAMYDTLGTYGILNIAATTNNNTNVDVEGDLPTACPSQYLIGVTMTDHNDVRANSGYGPTHVDLAAPGSGVTLTTFNNGFTTTSGTSFASPCVAGAVALAYSSPCPQFISYAKNDPSGAALAMRNYILSSVDVVANLSGEVATGGRLNVKNAIDSIMSNCVLTACNEPYSLHTDYITDTTAKFAWDGFSTDYLFYIQTESGPLVEIPLTNQDSIAFDTLTPCTAYTVWTKSICGTDTSDFSFPLSFTTDGCCNNPNLIMTYASADSITISWPSVLYASSYDLRYRLEGTTTWIDTLIDTIAPITFVSLDTCTAYEFQIKTICTDSTHGFGPSFIFSTKGCGACYEANYCAISGGNISLEWIDSVVVNWAVSVTGPNNGWYQSSNILTTFKAGLTYPVVLKPGYTNTAFTERFTIWIDLNHNGVFDASEALLENMATTSVISSSITIPITALDGITKMRIGMNGTTNPTACASSSFWGEYEDYCVYIGDDAGFGENTNDILIYPNPATNEITIVSSVQFSGIAIYGYDGKQYLLENGNSKQIDISALSPGMYIIQLQHETGTSIQKFIKQ